MAYKEQAGRQLHPPDVERNDKLGEKKRKKSGPDSVTYHDKSLTLVLAIGIDHG